MDRGDTRRTGPVQDGEPLDTYDTRQVSPSVFILITFISYGIINV